MQHGDLSALQIKRLYEELIRQITLLMSDLVFSSDEPFSFLKNAKINQLINHFLAEISQKMHTSIERSTKEAWELSVLNNQKFFEPYLNSGLLSAEQILHYNNRNTEALQSFLNRKTNGLNLSQRIWNFNKQFKIELEMALDVGLSQGKPAQEIALDILNYLHQPNALLQKVGQFRGSLHLSKMVDKMKQADPVLGSSYNKAMRLARTEVNMAYRASDLEKYRQLDFVLGYEIKRSNHPFGCPVCESLKGKYPKDFQFVGWHPNCRCYTVPILQKLEDFLDEKPAENEYITDVPDNFKQWVKDNTQRIQTAPSVPYWWKDNEKFVERGLSLDKKLVRYKDIPFKELEIKGNGKLEIFTKGKQRKQEFKSNLETLKILTEKGYKYRMLPIIEDGNKNPDAFNLTTQKFADIKNAESTNGKNIIQSAIKEAKAQGVEELIIRLKNKPTSYRDMYIGFKTTLLNRSMNIENITIILPDNSLKSYDIKQIVKKIRK